MMASVPKSPTPLRWAPASARAVLAVLASWVGLVSWSLPVALAGQTSEVTVEVGASRITPPTEVDGSAADFVVSGVRAGHYDLFGTGVRASVLVGRSLDAATGADFVSGEIGAALWHPLARGWSAGLDGRAFAFRVADPFGYRAGAVEGTAVLRYHGDVLSARLAGIAGAGRSQVRLSTVVQRMRRQVTVTETFDDDLWRYGGTLELLAGGGSVSAGIAGGLHRSAGGTYRSAGLRLLAMPGSGAVEARLDRWRSPDGYQTTGGIAFYLPWGPWRARGTAGRPEPDPLLMAEPGREAGGVLVGRTVLRRAPETRMSRALYRVVRRGPEESRVRFTVRAPDGASSVQLLGDFTLWEPVAMTTGERAGERPRTWTVEVSVPAGTYHFGFLVDGEWYLPDDAPDAVPDEWGRKSATLVVEDRGEPSVSPVSHPTERTDREVES